eukprot:Opistho-2@79752
MLHGEAVAIGMKKECEIARAMGIFSQANLGRLIDCIRSYKLDPTFPEHLAIPALMEKMAVDKKNSGGKKAVVVLKSIGKVNVKTAVYIQDALIVRVLSSHVTVAHSATPFVPNCSIAVPGSKSISNRVLLMAALGQGECNIAGLLHSDDTKVMLNALVALGVPPFRWLEDGNVVGLTGCGGRFTAPGEPLYLGNAGTAARFLTTVCTLVKESRDGAKSVLRIGGNKRMNERPIAPLVEALIENGCRVRYGGKAGSLPLEIEGTGLPGGAMRLSASISSQYVSSILIAAPYAEQPAHLSLVGGEVVSQPYIDMTLGVMRQFGVDVQRTAVDAYDIPKKPYANPNSVLVEGDASSASYPLAIAAITGGTVTVLNVGSNSLQGDAKFCDLMGRMGCTVRQSADTTTVTGPPRGQRLRAFDEDMSAMTDTFLTAAVLAAVAQGTTRIRGISNQRVKECNRIAAMVAELTKVGVVARELDDGIEIDGSDPATLHGAHIKCYDDHRVAMAFAVLNCAVPDIIITERACVEKTYPEFWDDLETKFGIPVVSAHSLSPEVHAQDKSGGSDVGRPFDMVIVGMRGSGKTHLGQAAAVALGRRFLDMDAFVEERLGMRIGEFVAANGWPAFREVESASLRDFFKERSALDSPVIVATGGGIVETEAGRDTLRWLAGDPAACTAGRVRSYAVVVQVVRGIVDVVAYLSSDPTRPSLGEPTESIWNRRKQHYRDCSNYEFVLRSGESAWSEVDADFVRFAHRVTDHSPRATRHAPSAALSTVGSKEEYESLLSFLGGERHTHFLSLTHGNYADASRDLAEMTVGISAVELRIDLLKDRSCENIAQQVAHVRRHTRLPLIYTVRSTAQGGAFDGDEHSMFALLRLGVRLGCEYIDVESTWSVTERESLYAQVHTANALVLSSYHVPKNASFGWTEAAHRMEECYAHGYADIVKFVGWASDCLDAVHLRDAVASFRVAISRPSFPVIAICMGDRGGLTRAANVHLSPVTHPLMPFKAAPGQLSVTELGALRSLSGLAPPRKYYLFGKPVAHSHSPAMHNAGFAALGLGHVYGLLETDDAATASETCSLSDFGGASVTIPLKEAMLSAVHQLSPSASAIGAINTIIKCPAVGSTKLYGDNTDWVGIRDCVAREMRVVARTGHVAWSGLVVGAGGTARAACYALQRLGCSQLFVYNRTVEKARTLADTFGGVVVENFEGFAGSSEVGVVVCTIPADARFTLPETFYENSFIDWLVVVDAAYKPRETALLAQARGMATLHSHVDGVRHPTHRHIATVEGADMLIAQGLAQFERWSGLPAPARAMEAAVRARLEG